MFYLSSISLFIFHQYDFQTDVYYIIWPRARIFQKLLKLTWHDPFFWMSSPRLGQSSKTKVKNLKRHYINDRTKCYWNKLPNDVDNALSLNIFKNALDKYKNANGGLNSGFYRAGNYWDLSYEVLNHIEDNSYLDNKQLFNEYLKDNPFVAQKKFINIH